jgi:sugar phosphate isomerase/epimerase
MLDRLGLKRVAYDWREQHVAEFEDEILAYKEHGIELFAFWRGHDSAFDLFAKYDIAPQIWKTVPSPRGTSNDERLEKAVEEMLPIARQTAEAGLELGLYNHGGWGGLPSNMVAICEALHEKGFKNVGLVYNFHHGHPRIASFSQDMKRMMPYLLCVNINGMLNPATNDVAVNANKIRPIGSGDHEASMIVTMINLGYEGPVGILGHVQTRDVEEVLQENLDGLQSIVNRMK